MRTDARRGGRRRTSCRPCCASWSTRWNSRSRCVGARTRCASPARSAGCCACSATNTCPSPSRAWRRARPRAATAHSRRVDLSPCRWPTTTWQCAPGPASRWTRRSAVRRSGGRWGPSPRTSAATRPTVTTCWRRSHGWWSGPTPSTAASIGPFWSCRRMSWSPPCGHTSATSPSMEGTTAGCCPPLSPSATETTRFWRTCGSATRRCCGRASPTPASSGTRIAARGWRTGSSA